MDMKPVPFFTDDIEIAAHSATHAADIGQPISVADFANGEPVSLYRLDNGELRCERRPAGPSAQCPVFIEGPETS